MTSFQDLGLREELLSTLEEEDFESATALQEAVIPVLRRGGNLVARASAGSGKMLAYALGVLDRVRPQEGPEGEEEGSAGIRALLLLPTAEEAERIALSLFPYAQGAGLTLTTTGGSWATPLERAELLVATPAAVMDAVRSAALKLDALEAVVVDGASALQELGSWEVVDTLLDHVPRDAQRVVFSSAFTPEIEDLIDRRVKRALRYPSEPAIAQGPPPAPEGEVGYVAAAEREKLELLARLLSHPRSGGAPPVLFCRSDERAALVAESLTMRGFLVGELTDPDTDIAVVTAGTSREEVREEAGAEPDRTLSYDVPVDARTLLARHRGDGRAIIFVEPRELAHLRDIAQQARLRLGGIPTPVEGVTAQGARLAEFRREIERALREEDLEAQMLILEPLLEEHPAAEIAAAVTALLRSRRPAAAPTAAAGAPAAPAAAMQERPEAGPPPATWARLYISIGSRDGIRPGDLVGAIAGEADIPGSRVGRIDIRDNFSIVEVQADVAEQVIAAVNGTTIKGRSARVDYDRGADRAKKTGERRTPPGGRSVRRPIRRREE